MYHSLIFVDGNNTWNTWDNWHLIPSKRPVVARPTLNFKYVDIPGADGSLDLSNYLIGRPTYSDCSGSFEFYVVDDKTNENWASVKAELSKVLDGREMRMTLEDDHEYYYVGRFTFSGWTPGTNYSTVTINYRVSPYKFVSRNGKKVLA